MMAPIDHDDLDDLRSAMAQATPRPDPAVRAAHLALAQENFARLQGATGPARLTPAPRTGLWRGVREMLHALTTKGGLAATTALVAVGFLVLTPLGRDAWERGPRLTGETADPLVKVEAPPRADAAPSDQADSIPTSPTQSVEPPVAEGRATTEAPHAEDPVRSQAPDVELGNEPAMRTLSDEAQADAVPSGRVTDPDAVTSPMPATPGNGRAATARESAEPSADMGGAMLTAPAMPAAPAPMMESEAFAGVIAQDSYMEPMPFPTPDTEAFANADENPLRITAETPVSTFSIDVDTASYAVVRQSLMAGALPPPDAVRVEEMVNYFPYDLEVPGENEGPFRPTISVTQTPWNPDTRLVTVQIQGETPVVAERPPLNLVFLIDTSGSMDEPAKLPLLRQSFRLMVDELRPEDRVAIVTYAGSAGLALEPTPASDRSTILKALNDLAAGGSTNGQGGLEQAYAVAEEMARGETEGGAVSRVILATDGDFNVGLDDPSALEDYIAQQRESGVYLSVLGFGRGNLDDATMQALAQNGNGMASYIDTLGEAQKVLVDQLTGALFPIASDVKVQVEWNPAAVAEYRLIGYETRALRREDFNDDRVDAGELGAGHAVTALYEVTPVGSPAQLSDPLRYAAEAETQTAPGETATEMGFLRLRWKAPGEGESQLLETPIREGDVSVMADGTEAGFAAAIAGWGQLLRGSPYLGDWGYDEAIALAGASRGEDPFGYRNEALRLMRLSQSLSED